MRRALMHGRGLMPTAATTVLAAALSLAGCDSAPPPQPQNFAALHFDYLTPIRLNVANVAVEDQSTPPDGDLSAQSPERPEAAMEQMAHDRLIAAGSSGTATFTVTEASITRADNGVTERLAARVEISNGSGGHAGFAEAHVTRTETPGDGRPAGPAALYELTREAMADMNVEFEYQVRHTLSDWVIAGGAAVAPVEQAPLSSGAPPDAAPPDMAPGPTPLTPPQFPSTSAAPSLAPDGGPLPLAPPGDAGAASSPPSMSPPPGYLALPSASPLPGAGGTTFPSYGNVPPSSQAFPPTNTPGPNGY